MAAEAGQEIVDRQRQAAAGDTRMLAEQAVHRRHQGGLDVAMAQLAPDQPQGDRLGHVTGEGRLGRIAGHRPQPLRQLRPLRGRRRRLAQRAFEPFRQPGGAQLRVERLEQVARVVAEAEGRLALAQFGKQIEGRGLRLRVLERQPALADEFRQGRRHLRLQRLDAFARAEQAAHRLRTERAFGPGLHVLPLLVTRPEQQRQRAGRGCMHQGARAAVQRHQRLQQPRRIVVVDPLIVAFAIARRGELAHQPIERGRVGQGVFQRVQVQSIAPVHGGVEDQSGQVLAAVERRRFGIQRHLPPVAQRVEFGIVDGLVVVGAGQVHGQAVAARQDGQVQRLDVDAEPVARTQPDDVAAVLEQVAAVAQAAHRLVAHALEARLQVVGLDAVAVLAQAPGQLAQLEDQRVAGEESVELVERYEALGAPDQAFEDARGRIEHRLRLALALV